MSGCVLTYFEKIQNKPSVSYFRIRLNMLMYVVIIFMQKYAHICLRGQFSWNWSKPILIATRTRFVHRSSRLALSLIPMDFDESKMTGLGNWAHCIDILLPRTGISLFPCLEGEFYILFFNSQVPCEVPKWKSYQQRHVLLVVQVSQFCSWTCVPVHTWAHESTSA